MGERVILSESFGIVAVSADKQVKTHEIGEG